MILSLPLGTNWQLAEPMWLLLALLPPAVLLWRNRRREVAPTLPWSADLPATMRQRARPLIPALQVVGLALWSVALARPIEMRTLPAESEGIDILLVLDRSSSMAERAGGSSPTDSTRLAEVQAAAAAFVADRTEDRLGLLSFARYPDLLTPPTTDQSAVAALLRSIQPESQDSAEDMTGIGAAVARGAQVLARSGSSTRVLILWTDGQENVATRATPKEIPPGAAAQLCRRLGVRVHVVRAGGGSEGLDAMRDLASSTGGRMFSIADSTQADEVFAAIDTLERTPLPRPRVEAIERALPLLLLGLLCWGLGGLLGHTVMEGMP